MLGAGDSVPNVPVWSEAGGDPVSLASLGEGRSFLLLFYLYDWSAT